MTNIEYLDQTAFSEAVRFGSILFCQLASVQNFKIFTENNLLWYYNKLYCTYQEKHNTRAAKVGSEHGVPNTAILERKVKMCTGASVTIS